MDSASTSAQRGGRIAMDWPRDVRLGTLWDVPMSPVTEQVLEAALALTVAEINRLKLQADEAVEATHRQYRRDLVPIRQTLTVYREPRPR